MTSKMENNANNPPAYSAVYPGPDRSQVIGPNQMVHPNYQPPIMHPQFIPQPQVIPLSFGPDPQSCVCPHCRAPIISRVSSEPNSKTHGMALLLFCCLCWPCAWLPYFMDSCQNQNHYCPNCGAFLGAHNN